jgi:hypothetical protein
MRSQDICVSARVLRIQPNQWHELQTIAGPRCIILIREWIKEAKTS